MCPDGKEGGDRPDQGRPARKSATPGQRPALTERQRREAREARRKRAKRSPARKRKERPRGNPLVAGIRATGRELARTVSFLGDAALAGLAALAPLGSALADALRKVGAALGVGARETFRAVRIAARAIGAVIESADRFLTPLRAIVIVALGSAILLGVSQFIEYRAVEIGQPGYSGVLDVVSAPTTDGRTPIDQHSLLLVVAAILALAGTIGATGGRRWGGIAVTAAGLLSVVVGLLVDLPAGTDASDIAAAYSGAEPVLLAGFWLQLSAGLGLTVCGALLVASAGADRKRRAGTRRRRTVAAEGTG
ncbi:MAG: hypothetical protein ACO3ZZ_01725 [Solirubrobacterales bacterium]